MALTSNPVKPRGQAPPPGVPRIGPITLSIDVGGTGIKAELLDPVGKPLKESVRVHTEYPLPPSAMLDVFKKLAGESPGFGRVSIGFPGVVRGGLILSAPHFIREGGEGTPISNSLTQAWDHYDLAGQAARALGKPTRVGNDAEVQGMAVVKGKGLEVVVTLGTAFGSAVFQEGKLGVHLELAHQPCHNNKTYSEYVGEAARQKVGDRRWNRRVLRSVELVRALLFFDHLFVGGGNSSRVKIPLGDDVTLVDNSAGLLGGIRLWDPVKNGGRQVR